MKKIIYILLLNLFIISYVNADIAIDPREINNGETPQVTDGNISYSDNEIEDKNERNMAIIIVVALISIVLIGYLIKIRNKSGNNKVELSNNVK